MVKQIKEASESVMGKAKEEFLEKVNGMKKSIRAAAVKNASTYTIGLFALAKSKELFTDESGNFDGSAYAQDLVSYLNSLKEEQKVEKIVIDI